MKRFWNRYRIELCLYAAYVLLSLCMMRGPWLPHIFPEEAGYIGWANRILTGKGSGEYFLPGYSLLLTPLLAINREIPSVYPFLLVENVLLNGFLIVGLYRLCRLWGGKTKESILTAAAISLYPSYVLYTQKAICEPLLTVGGVWLTLLAAQALEEKKKSRLVLFGILCVWMIATHTREFVLFGVVPLLLLFCSDKKKLVGGIVGAAILIGGACFVWVMTDPGTNARHFQEQIRGILTVHGMGRFLLTLISQASYWILSTLGLAPVGLWYGGTLIKEKKQGWTAAFFALLFFAATAVLSAFYMSHHSRAIQIIYGRYNDSSLAAITVLGTIALWQRKKPSLWLWGISLGAVGLTVVRYRGELLLMGNKIGNALGVYIGHFLTRDFDYAVTALALGCCALLIWWLGRKKTGCSIMILCGFYLFQLLAVPRDFYRWQPVPYMLQVIDRLDESDRELTHRDGYVWNYYRCAVYRPELSMTEEDRAVQISQKWDPAEALIGIENENFWTLRTEEAKKKYWALILPADGVITNPDCEIHLLERKENSMQIAVKNTGSPWICLSAIGDVQKAVRLGVRYFDGTGRLIREDRKDFSYNLLQGDEERFELPLPKAAAVISCEPVQDFVGWFGEEKGLTVNRTGQKTALPENDREFRTIYPDDLLIKTESEALPYRNNLEGFQNGWTAERAAIRHIKMPCRGAKELVITGEGHPTTVTVNGSVVLRDPVKQGNQWRFSLNGFAGEVSSLELECIPFNPFRESGLPGWLSFLSMDSNYKPVQWLVSGIKTCFGVDVNSHDFGMKIESISVE